MEDIAPELLERLRKRFSEKVAANPKIRAIQKKIRSGGATYVDAENYAYLVGETLSQTFGELLSSSVLPDGRMYFNIADRVIRPLMEEDHKIVSNAATMVQKHLNEKASIGIKPQTVAVNEDRIYGIVDKVSDAEQFDDVAWVLDEPVKNFSMNVVDETLKANVKLHGRAGLSPKIIRKSEWRCCEWCSRLAGEYDYPDVPDDVYRRHVRCRCMVLYDPADGSKMLQNVHTKEKKTREQHIAEYNERERQRQMEEFTRKFKRTFQAVPQDKAIAAMRKDSEEWIKSLSESEMESIRKYTGNGDTSPKFYQRLNQMLRGESPEDDNLRYHANTISGALKRSTLGENIICYRGMDVNPVLGIATGSVVDLSQFTSTTLIPSKSFDADVSITIYAPKGTKGAAYIEKISEFPKQREILFDKDCRYMVLSNKQNYVELVVI